MRLIRNITPDQVCKYGLLRLDNMRRDNMYELFLKVLRDEQWVFKPYVELQKIGDPEESFVLKLKDKLAPNALREYGYQHGQHGDEVFQRDMFDLAKRAECMPNRKMPD